MKAMFPWDSTEIVNREAPTRWLCRVAPSWVAPSVSKLDQSQAGVISALRLSGSTRALLPEA